MGWSPFVACVFGSITISFLNFVTIYLQQTVEVAEVSGIDWCTNYGNIAYARHLLIWLGVLLKKPQLMTLCMMTLDMSNDQSQWVERTPKGPNDDWPQRSYLHSLNVIADSILMFGGWIVDKIVESTSDQENPKFEKRLTDKFWAYDLIGCKWKQIQTEGAKSPPPRHRCVGSGIRGLGGVTRWAHRGHPSH